MSFRVNKWRIILAGAGFVSVVFAPWWVPAIISIVLCLRYRAWEVVGIGLFVDILWLPQTFFEDSVSIPFATFGALLLLLIFEPLRRRLLVR